MASVRILTGHVLDKLADLPAESVNLCITSPPYFGLRNYGSDPQTWGGDPGCDHDWGEEMVKPATNKNAGFGERQAAKGERWSATNAHEPEASKAMAQGAFCRRCTAWRGELGQEPTLDLFLAHLVEVFAAVRRVLHPSGLVFVNMGDSYNAGGRIGHGTRVGYKQQTNRASANGADNTRATDPDTKPKDLLLVPFALAMALRADGWYVRSVMPWVKRNCMPESAQDRPGSAVEYVIMLAKQPRYFWDATAVRRRSTTDRAGVVERSFSTSDPTTTLRQDIGRSVVRTDGRNMRNSDPFYDSLTLFDLPAVEVEPIRPATRGQKPWSAGAVVPGGQPQRDGNLPGRGNAVGGLVNAGPEGPPLGLILNDDGEPMALDVNPAPFKKAHFATFPPKLVEPFVKGGSSERGVCPACRSPWERVVEKGDIVADDGRERTATVYPKSAIAPGDHHGANLFRDGYQPNHRYESKTLGWQPTCRCFGRWEEIEEPNPAYRDGEDWEPWVPQLITRRVYVPGSDDPAPAPALVLDPFGGSGTVGAVAKKLGRDAVLIDLKPEYNDMAEERQAQEVLPMVVTT